MGRGDARPQAAARGLQGREWGGILEEGHTTYRNLGSAVSSPSEVWGGAVAQIYFLKVVVTVTTTFKSGGELSPPTHTKLCLWLSHGIVATAEQLGY